MATIPAAGYISNAARTQSQVQTALEDIVASLRQVPGAGQAEIYHVIASGTLTPAGSAGIVLVDTEGLAATDDLANVATTNYPDGSMIVLRNANLGRVVTLKHLAGGAGQVNLDRSVDYVMDDEKKWILIQRRGADWYEVFRGPNRLTSFTVSKSSAFTVNKEDLGKTFTCTGTYTVSLSSAASLGNGFVVTIRNVGSGLLTIDPNSTELVGGSTTLIVMAGWSYVLLCDATGWQILGSTGPYPAPNPIINASMDFWQRGSTFTAATNDTYTADRWIWRQSGAGVVTVNRYNTTLPATSASIVSFLFSLEVDVTTADATIAAGDFYTIGQKIEGGTWRHFAQRQFTLSFWVTSTKTGTHCVAFRNSGVDRSYVAEYTISAANTWEYKSVTVTASPSAGTWDYTTGVGLDITFALAGGSTFQTTAGAWQTGNFLTTSAQVNCLDSTSNFFRITGVKLELGAYPTILETVSYEEEFIRCARYYQKSFFSTTTPAQNVGSNTGEWVFTSPVGASTLFNSITVPYAFVMRAATSITFYNPNAANAQVRNRTLSTDCTGTTAYNGGEKSFALQATTPASTATTHTMAVHWAAHAEL